MNTVTSIFSDISAPQQGSEALQSARISGESANFAGLVRQMQAEKKQNVSNVSSDQISEAGRLNGDYRIGFDRAFTSESDKTARPQGFAANSLPVHGTQKTIDKTSKLYEKSLELESYFVKMMLSSMRQTINKASEDGYGQRIYEDMLYDEYASQMTRNAGFGLADQIYLELA
jgi:flagellar protein FlgJ